MSQLYRGIAYTKTALLHFIYLTVMFTIELNLRGNPVPIIISRKDQEGADSLYQLLTAAMQGDGEKVLHLTCDKQEGRKIAVLGAEILAIQVSSKTGTPTGIGAGFVRN